MVEEITRMPLGLDFQHRVTTRKGVNALTIFVVLFRMPSMIKAKIKKSTLHRRNKKNKEMHKENKSYNIDERRRRAFTWRSGTIA